MPIQEQNIVFVESQVMDDVPEGGGAATGNVITDGAMNNVFEDISDLDRAYGRFNLRKIALAVRTLSTDLYGGAKSVLTQLPADPAIAYTLFDTGDPFDTRADAADRVEAYLYKGPTWPGYLLENHITGMRAINVLQRIGTALPPIGKTLVLVQDEGLAGEKEQYVRVTKVTVTEATFTDNIGDYQRWVVTLDLSDALRHNFTGHTANRHESSYSYTNRVRIRDTTVADATRYYGGQPLAAPAAIGDLSVRAASMFAQLVPSAQTETPLVNQILAPEITRTVSAGARSVDVAQQAHTRALAVTAENRRFNWIETLAPLPAAGALTVSYRAQGNWYTLTADSAGILAGSDPSIGAGTLDYATGAMSVTLGALPDVGSQIMITWASPVHFTVRAGASSDADTALEMTLQAQKTPLAAASVVVEWLSGGVLKTASADATGALSGHATGAVSLIDGRVRVRFSTGALPDRASTVTLRYDWDDPTDPYDQAVKTVTMTSESVTVPETALKPGGVTVAFRVSQPDGSIGAFSASDNGLGTLIFQPGSTQLWANSGPWGMHGGQTIGTVNYATGAVSLASSVTMARMDWTSSAWEPSSGTGTIISSDVLGAQNQPVVTYTSTTVPVTTREETETTAASAAGLTLTLRGTAHLVVFRHHDTAKEGEDVAHYSDPDGTDWVRPTLRFMTVPE